MVRIKIDRKTGKTIAIERGISPADQGPEKMAAIVVEWAIRTGAIKTNGGITA